ncbi:hypothetical protein [Pseudomonas syringae]|uniref:Uncharacterized protein n=1 Tax=Pseudomonas syringae pv. syringae TaxID=321 RepID=A0AAE5SBX4_PSESY|nr:hypothetical protein [Pseudomonas syringae]MEE4733617.1 hypothetical protein [Pseudomonas alliivorans]PBP48895.1 hypothetical protein CCL10_24795 [Pseudomonas syringae]POD33403.1 hypothetical protein BKM14_00810 [Pseudomonas syringae pv. syringae]POD52840.1 hypothetical protein BKM15_13195 [Pseudomonas syringae pv. syringae]POQ05982.1 hypothetical protein CXB42_00700 [Pseudomonas syringae pv. syringae]
MRWISTIALALLAGSMASGVEQPKRIDQNGVVGIWFDEIGEAETSIEHNESSYRLKRVNSDGSVGDYRLRREGMWLHRDDNLKTRYQIIGDRLDVFDNQGFIRSMELIQL